MNTPTVGISGFQLYVETMFDKTISWKDIRWLTTITQLPIIVKGVLSANDAMLAHHHGARAVIVSNHGARQLDSTPSTV